MLETTINFNNRDEANEFAKAWSRKSLMGHTIKQNSVSIYNITENLKTWIDAYITKLNEANTKKESN